MPTAFHMVDGASDMIASGGFNVYPAGLENGIAGHPDVIEATVFGILHERWGEAGAGMSRVTASRPDGIRSLLFDVSTA